MWRELPALSEDIPHEAIPYPRTEVPRINEPARRVREDQRIVVDNIRAGLSECLGESS
jgi:hypothetical protein